MTKEKTLAWLLPGAGVTCEKQGKGASGGSPSAGGKSSFWSKYMDMDGKDRDASEFDRRADDEVLSGSVLEYGGETVYAVDGVATVIRRIRGNVAEGAIVEKDLTLRPCYVARENGYFAHGATLREAVSEARRKYEAGMPVAERIKLFVKSHPDPDAKVRGEELFDAHGRLTGSCRMGREAFCRDHGLDPSRTKMSVREFIALTESAYGSDVICQLKAAYGKKLS